MHINENVFLDIVPKQNRRKQYATIGRYVIKVNHPSLVTCEQNVHIRLSNYFANNQFCNFFVLCLVTLELQPRRISIFQQSLKSVRTA